MRELQAAGGTALSAPRPRGVLSPPFAWALAGGIAACGYAADLVTKQLALAHLDPANPPVLLGGLLRLQLISNPGAAFSMGEGFTVVLTLIALAALVVVLGFMLPRARHRGWVVALGLLLAGILGNLTDRIFRPPAPLHGHVVDFLQLPHFAIFNVADICITASAVLIVWLVAIAQVDLGGASTREPREREGA